MTSIATLNHSDRHSGVARANPAPEASTEAAAPGRAGFFGTRGLATLLLSAMAAAVMVVAYQVMDSAAEGHLLVLWIGLWAVAFAVLALFAGTARNLAARLKGGLDAWSQSLAEARADQRMWAVARSDPRVMSDLLAAIAHQEAQDEVAPASGKALTKTAVTPAVSARIRDLTARPYYQGCYY